MWEFSNLNSGSTFWPPDSGQPQNSIACPTTGISHGPSVRGIPFPGFRLQGSVLQFNSTNWSPMNTLAPNPTINFSEPEATKRKRFLVFDYSGDQTSLVFSSVACPFEGLNPTLPLGSVANTNASNSHISEENKVHEDTEEIDALLYSDSEHIYDDEESSTGHSPLDMEKEDIASSYLPAKRRRVDSTEIDTLLMDTASSAVALSPHFILEDGSNDLGFNGCIGDGKDKTGQGSRSRCNKRDSIHATVSMLRRIIPGGKGKDTVSVLDEAIQYLKSLQLQAKAAGANSFTL
ncbi:transcription factor bHLH143-like [Phalaenopsis equestris]|uniref:transcription factor bHLH143-like n=1 Tax=Phalaenopsis equestris TaxID=78828 RepID=UPI0009E40F0D|nr:transcription factor bHLH143-like [Phalaenopsis equestris]XP_020593238.1 transcription factor bHLH143-like [Phalaenopsis equestris]